MPLLRLFCLLPLALACGALAAQEPTSSAKDKAPEKPVEGQAAKDKDPSWEGHHFRSHPSEFGASVQGDLPLRDLKQKLDHRTGLGLGVQWTHDYSDWNASRTRLEWNTFPEGGGVGPLATQTYAKNYLFSFDHLFKLNQGRHQAYVVAGLGGVRWDLQQTTGGFRTSEWTTKLAVTAGVGVQLAHRMNLEARYLVSSVNTTFDGNVMQASLGWHF